MKKFFELYKNKYFKILVFIVFMIAVYSKHSALRPLKQQQQETKNYFVKKVKTVLTKHKNDHASYTAQTEYEYIGDNEEVDKKISLRQKLQEIFLKKSQETQEHEKLAQKIKQEEQAQLEKRNAIEQEFQITSEETKNKANRIRCGDTVKYSMVTYLNGKLAYPNVIESRLVVGINMNKTLERLFLKKQKGDVFEVEHDIFLQEAGNSNINNYNKQYGILTYRIKILDITKGSKQLLKTIKCK